MVNIGPKSLDTTSIEEHQRQMAALSPNWPKNIRTADERETWLYKSAETVCRIGEIAVNASRKTAHVFGSVVNTIQITLEEGKQAQQEIRAEAEREDARPAAPVLPFKRPN